MSNARVVFLDDHRQPDAAPGLEFYFDFTCPNGNGRCHHLPIAGRVTTKRDGQGRNGGTPQWDWDGNREAPTFKPSVNCIGCWHGYIRKGRCVNTSGADEPEPLTPRETPRTTKPPSQEPQMSDVKAAPTPEYMTSDQIDETLAGIKKMAGTIHGIGTNFRKYVGQPEQLRERVADIVRRAELIGKAAERLTADKTAKAARRSAAAEPPAEEHV